MPIERLMEYGYTDGEESLVIGWDNVADRACFDRLPMFRDEGDLRRLLLTIYLLGVGAAIPVSFGMYMLLRWLGV